jgi:hypothetical protein
VRFLAELGVAFSRARQLRGRTRTLYNWLSWLMVAVGCVLVVWVMFSTRAAFGLPMGRASLEGLRLQMLAWVGVTVLSIPVLFYLGMVLVGSAFSLLMLLSGRFTWSEAKAFALYAQPPQRWVEVQGAA